MAARRSGVKVVGLGKLSRELRQLQGDADDLKDANAEAAQIVAQAAQVRAPRRTGRTAASIRGNRAARRAVVTFGGSAAPGAGPTHYGWPARHIAAQPFATDAAQQTEPIWLQAYVRNLDRAISKVRGA